MAAPVGLPVPLDPLSKIADVFPAVELGSAAINRMEERHQRIRQGMRDLPVTRLEAAVMIARSWPVVMGVTRCAEPKYKLHCSRQTWKSLRMAPWLSW